MIVFALLLSAATTSVPNAHATADLKVARAAFDYGDFGLSAMALERLVPASGLSDGDRGEALKLLGLSRFYLKSEDEARRAFLQLLTLDPDYQLDPFYVPPAAVSFFESVRVDNDMLLAPLRAKRQSDKRTEETSKAAELQRLQEAASRVRVDVVERHYVRRPYWTVLLPFGIAQMENGDAGLSLSIGMAQVAAAAASVLFPLGIEALRNPNTGLIPSDKAVVAGQLKLAQYGSAGLFYVLWGVSWWQASRHYQAEALESESRVAGATESISTPNKVVIQK